MIANDVPAGTRAAQVRLVGKQANTAFIFDWRIDADYTEPAGAFRPVKITYEWQEDGHPKGDVHVVKSPSETYTINCGPKTVVKSFAMELAE